MLTQTFVSKLPLCLIIWNIQLESINWMYFISGSRDVLSRRLFQLMRCNLDLILVSDEVGCLKNNLIDTLRAEKVTNKCQKKVKRHQNPPREVETNTTIKEIKDLLPRYTFLDLSYIWTIKMKSIKLEMKSIAWHFIIFLKYIHFAKYYAIFKLGTRILFGFDVTIFLKNSPWPLEQS